MADLLPNVKRDMQPDSGRPLQPSFTFMEKFRLYETESKFYMVGWDKSRTYWKVLKIDRQEPSELNIREDPSTYSATECTDLLRRIHEGNKTTGGLKFVTACYGIIGFIKFLGPYYLLVITERRQIGAIYEHSIYSVSKSRIIPIPNSTVSSRMVYNKDEDRYKKLLSMVDLTKDFFFSYSYHVMRSLQNNMCDNDSGLVLYETMFVWNEFLTRGIRNILQNTSWTVALVYGYFKQDTFSISGRSLSVTLIARRSRHYAGTRYLKRGVNEHGSVANDVETEQVVMEKVSDGLPVQISSVVQHRGSIPLFWSQETSRLNIKPDIILSKKDQTYEATKLHFENLFSRYGNPIIILNLIKTNEKRPRESVLRAEFANAIDFINKELPEECQLKFLHWDLNKHSRSKDTNVLQLLGKVAVYALTLTGFFYCHVAPVLPSLEYCNGPNSRNITVTESFDPGYSDIRNTNLMDHENVDKDKPARKYFEQNCISGSNDFFRPQMLQKGVLRTNCIDCLDRTNVAQYAYGLAALGNQLRAIGVTTSSRIELDDPLAAELMGFYERMGDTLAHQYGGSAAHNKIFSERRGQWKPAIESQEFFRTLQRYYSNAYMDVAKQNAINVFLGYFQPQPGEPNVWELDSELRNNVRRNGELNLGDSGRSFVKRSLSDGSILHENPLLTSTSNISKVFSDTQCLTQLNGVSELLSESTPEIPISGSKLACSRDSPPVPARVLSDAMQRKKVLEQENREVVDWSNFLDLDLLSSGNSFEEDLSERSMLSASPIEVLSSEDTVDEMLQETSSSTLGYGSSTMGKELTGTDQSCAGTHDTEVVEGYPDTFVNWVTNGGMLCH